MSCFAYLLTRPTCSAPSTIQIILSTAHPAKFSEAVCLAVPNVDFEKDVMPEELKGLLKMERRVVDVERPEIDLVKKVIEEYAT